MANVAAFFDLDRTLLTTSSGRVFSSLLREQGLLTSESNAAERALFGLFDLLGENLPTILLTRQASKQAAGWSKKQVQKVGEKAATQLVEQIEPYAKVTIEKHRQQNHKLVMATTSPFDLVEPLAKKLGFDAVLATRYRTDAKGNYDGTIDGEFVWSKGKARSAQSWSLANLVDLKESYAYSDSFYDRPLLSMVGYPVAVNPDPRLWAYASAQGWKTTWFDAPPGVPTVRGVETQTVLTALAKPELFPWLDLHVEGVENIPTQTPAVLASNHRSFLDPLVVAYLCNQKNRKVRFLAKKELTDVPIVGSIISALGVIPVGDNDTEESKQSPIDHTHPVDAAVNVLEAGELVALFPEGTVPRKLDSSPVLEGRSGAVRIAQKANTPIIPIGVSNSELVWPRDRRLPYLLNIHNPPTVRVTVGAPFYPKTGDDNQATTELMGKIQALISSEVAV